MAIYTPINIDVIKRNDRNPALQTETQTNAFIIDLAIPRGVSKRV